MTFRSLTMMSALLALGACGDDGGSEGDDDHSHEETVDECPADLTYAASAAPVLQRYCAACHAPTTASALGASNIIDTEARIREHGKGLYDLVFSGEMPKTGTIPAAEKKNFLDWMECSGAAAGGHDHSH